MAYQGLLIEARTYPVKWLQQVLKFYPFCAFSMI